ncbi:MAG: protein-L-isoaspartate(D-aspartate) O-methyltransferase [Bacteroidota bacterium]|jgi:protein-L-isoaspartate(D-aspartate) O-methyltransferase
MTEQTSDSFRHLGLRRKLVFELRSKGIKDEAVLQAIAEIPRHLFLDNAFVEMAYEDRAFPILSGQTISHPSTVAFQTSLLELKPGMKVLEIGTGSGYQASVLFAMGVKVFTLERHKQLYIKTKSLVEKLGYGIKMFLGDGFEGLSTYAPFDRILVTCGAAEFPHKLIDQLKKGGVMVIPYGVENEYCMTKITKDSSGNISFQAFDSFKFVPMVRKISRS